MKPELYTQVALTKDLPDEELKVGDVATIVDYITAPDGEEGCILEVFNALGESMLVLPVPLSAVAPLRADELLSVRPYKLVR